jgi:alkylation response protein AidB-like acyl-CoA dehydrogenase
VAAATGITRLARQVADDLLQPAAAGVDASGQIPASHLDQLAASGLYGLPGPREFGGGGADHATVCQVLEILAGACLSTTFVLLQHLGAVRAVAESSHERLRTDWLQPLCLGQRRAGLALAGAMPGPPMLRARPAPGGYVFYGTSPWVSGWSMIDTLHTAARDTAGNVIWALLDAVPGPALSVEPLDMIAVMATRTVRATFRDHFVPADRISGTVPLADWQARDAAGLRSNGSLALGIAGRCCALIGPSPLDDELASVRKALDEGTMQTMPAARAAAAELAVRAATALVVSSGSGSILAGSQAQRLVREAVFLLMFGTRPAIKEHLTGLLMRR